MSSCKKRDRKLHIKHHQYMITVRFQTNKTRLADFDPHLKLRGATSSCMRSCSVWPIKTHRLLSEQTWTVQGSHGGMFTQPDHTDKTTTHKPLQELISLQTSSHMCTRCVCVLYRTWKTHSGVCALFHFTVKANTAKVSQWQRIDSSQFFFLLRIP